jgi:diacylglycerol O-acyltransferase / wax synthase
MTPNSTSAATSARWRAASRRRTGAAGHALAVIAAPLPRTAPLWSAVLVTGLADGAVALVLVLHHALADGVGGLAVLANLVDAPASASSVCFPRPAPTAAGLAREAFLGRLRALRHSRQS